MPSLQRRTTDLLSSPDATEELLSLYELVLSVGRSRGVEDNCRAFADVLQSRRDIAYVGVWLFAGGGCAELVHGSPPTWTTERRISSAHPLFGRLGSLPFFSIHSSAPGYGELITERGTEEGAFAIFHLGDLGALKLFAHRDRAFPVRELNQLRQAAEKLTSALEAALAARDLVQENLERRRVEAALQESEGRIRDFADSAADWFWETDVDHRIIYLSENFARVTGLHPDRLLNVNLLIWLGDCAVSEREGLVRSIYQHVSFDAHDVTWTARDGSERIHGFRGKAIFWPDNSFRGYRGSAVDVTAQRRGDDEKFRLEVQLRQAQKMEAIGQLTGGIAHDFNNSLAAILGFAELAEPLTESADPRLGSYLGEIQLAAEQARELVAKMLTFSRGGSGQTEVLALAPIAKETIGLLRSTFPSSIEIRMWPPETSAGIESDPVSVQQVLVNLCINSRDAITAEQGAVDIRIREVVVDNELCASCGSEVSGKFVQLSVQDSGHGVGIGVRQRMFEPFFTTKAAGKGTGMGLSMVHGIAHRDAGHVLVRSEPEIGTEICILWQPVPLSEPLDVENEEAPVILAVQGQRVLVVDDEVAIGAFIGELMTRYGYRVTVKSDSREARQLLSETPDGFDLLITDQTMPGLKGRELIRFAREVKRTLPAILISGYTEPMERFEDEGNNIAFLLKPVSSQKILQTAQSLLMRDGAS